MSDDDDDVDGVPLDGAALLKSANKGVYAVQICRKLQIRVIEENR